MPAIQLARLKIQTAALGEYFSQPELFIRRLHELLDYYSDRTLRPGQARTRVPLLPHYHIAPPVMRQIEAELDRHVRESSVSDSLNLADALWNAGYFETQQLAAFILSTGLNGGVDPILSRLRAWAVPDVNAKVMSALLQVGRKGIAKTAEDRWLTQIAAWLDADSAPIQAIGVRALTMISEDPAYQNLPVIFNMLAPVAENARVAIHPELAELIMSLARRSPAETAFFLRRVLISAHDPSVTRLVRRCLPAFDLEQQKRLREGLVDRSRNQLDT